MNRLIILIVSVTASLAHALTPGRYERNSPGNHDIDIMVFEPPDRMYFEYTRQVGGFGGLAGDGVIPNPTNCRIRHWGSWDADAGIMSPIKVNLVKLAPSPAMNNARACERYVSILNEKMKTMPWKFTLDIDAFKLTTKAAVPLIALEADRTQRSIVFEQMGATFTSSIARDSVQTMTSKSFRNDLSIQRLASGATLYVGVGDGDGDGDLDYGFIIPMGTIDLEQIDVKNPSLRFALSSPSSHGMPETFWRNQQRRWQKGVVFEDLLIADAAILNTGNTYLIRSIIEGIHDLILAIKVVEYDPDIQALVIESRLLRDLPIPQMQN